MKAIRADMSELEIQGLHEYVHKKYGAEKIPYVSIATSVNMAGGQPISMKNLRELREYTQKHNIRIIHDMTRVAENAYFIKQKEVGYDTKSIKEIVKEINSYTDGATMSAKKDALVNIGGFLGHIRRSSKYGGGI
jgi:tyrosine phenol-lyase